MMKLRVSFLCAACIGSAFAEDLQVERSLFEKGIASSVVSGLDRLVWESFPIGVDNVSVQVLDKISGKVFRSKLRVKQSLRFGTIVVSMKKAFRSNPDDKDEVYAYVEIEEKGKIVFFKWLFASSPVVNFFQHPVYDIRLEFKFA